MQTEIAASPKIVLFADRRSCSGDILRRLCFTVEELHSLTIEQILELEDRIYWPKLGEGKADIVAHRLKTAFRHDVTVEEADRDVIQVIENIEGKPRQIAEILDMSLPPRKETPEVVAARAKRYRAKRHGLSPERLTGYQANKAKLRAGKKTCFVCGAFRTGPHHVIPRSEGGLPIADNIVWLCDEHHNQVEGPSAGAWDRIHAAKRMHGAIKA